MGDVEAAVVGVGTQCTVGGTECDEVSTPAQLSMQCSGEEAGLLGECVEDGLPLPGFVVTPVRAAARLDKDRMERSHTASF